MDKNKKIMLAAAAGVGVLAIGGLILYKSRSSQTQTQKKEEEKVAPIPQKYAWSLRKFRAGLPTETTLIIGQGQDPKDRRCFSDVPGGKGCKIGLGLAEFAKLKLSDSSLALACGADHQAKYGYDGYKVGHWCQEPLPLATKP